MNVYTFNFVFIFAIIWFIQTINCILLLFYAGINVSIIAENMHYPRHQCTDMLQSSETPKNAFYCVCFKLRLSWIFSSVIKKLFQTFKNIQILKILKNFLQWSLLPSWLIENNKEIISLFIFTSIAEYYL